MSRLAGKLAPPLTFLRCLNSSTTPHKITHKPAAITISFGFGEKISTKPLSFTSAAKLETQKGMRNRRNVGQNPSFIRVRLSLVSLLARHGACAHAREVWAQAVHEPAMHKKDVVSFADDARQEMATRCEMPPPKHVATR